MQSGSQLLISDEALIECQRDSAFKKREEGKRNLRALFAGSVSTVEHLARRSSPVLVSLSIPQSVRGAKIVRENDDDDDRSATRQMFRVSATFLYFCPTQYKHARVTIAGSENRTSSWRRRTSSIVNRCRGCAIRRQRGRDLVEIPARALSAVRQSQEEADSLGRQAGSPEIDLIPVREDYAICCGERVRIQLLGAIQDSP